MVSRIFPPVQHLIKKRQNHHSKLCYNLLRKEASTLLTPTEKKYLLAVYLTIDEGSTRLKRVSEFLKVKMPSAKQALEELARKKLIDYVTRGPISLTKKGKEMAEIEKERFDNLVNFLVEVLFLDKEKAQKGAWEIFFNMDDDVAQRLIDFMNFLSKCPLERPICLKGFEEFIKTGEFIHACVK